MTRTPPEQLPRNRTEYVADAVRKILVVDGINELSLRNIAEIVGCSPSTLVQRFRSRRVLMLWVARCLADEWLSDLVGIDPDHRSLLPRTELQRMTSRAWLAMEELARNDPAIAETVAQARFRERQIVQRCVPRQLDDVQLTGLVALLDGLRVAVARRPDPLSTEAAQSVLDLHLTVLRPGPATASTAAAAVT